MFTVYIQNKSRDTGTFTCHNKWRINWYFKTTFFLVNTYTKSHVAHQSAIFYSIFYMILIKKWIH